MGGMITDQDFKDADFFLRALKTLDPLTTRCLFKYQFLAEKDQKHMITPADEAEVDRLVEALNQHTCAVVVHKLEKSGEVGKAAIHESQG